MHASPPFSLLAPVWFIATLVSSLYLRDCNKPRIRERSAVESSDPLYCMHKLQVRLATVGGIKSGLSFSVRVRSSINRTSLNPNLIS
jgi:hypothetical protein